MVVIHRQQQDTSQSRCEQCIGVDGNLKEFEDSVANGGIGEDEQQIPCQGLFFGFFLCFSVRFSSAIGLAGWTWQTPAWSS